MYHKYMALLNDQKLASLLVTETNQEQSTSQWVLMALPPVTAPSRATRPSTSRIYLCMQDNAATFLEREGSCPAESLLQTQVHIHKTCYKFFSEVKDSHKQQMFRFTIFRPAVPSLSNCQQWTSQQAKGVPESKELKATESTITQVSFLYCSTGFTLTSKKEQTPTKS